MKCVAYCRVSKDSQDQLNSLENQIKHYTELFKKEGYNGAECGMYYSKERKKATTRYISSIFADEGISGTKLKNREAFKYMLECAKMKKFDIIYVKNVPRWARSVEDGSGILKKLKVMGIKVIFEDGNLNNFDHEMTLNILLSTAQEESRAKSTAVQFGIRKAQQAGKFTSAPPYGYCLEKGYLKPIPEQLGIVGNIFDMYLKGWGGIKISNYLNLKGIKTQKSRRWTQTQIYGILSNCIYIGKQITHTVVNTDINIDKITLIKGNTEYNYRSRKPVDEDNWIITQRNDLRAVTDEIFYLAKKESQKRRILFCNGSRQSSENVLSNLLFCQHCGKALRRKRLSTWKRKNGTYDLKYEWVCTSHDQYNNKVCNYRNSWEERRLLEKVRYEIENLKSNGEIFNELFDRYIRVFLNSENVKNRLEELNDKITDIKKQILANLRLYSKDIINSDQYKQQNDELQTQKKSIEAEISKILEIEKERKLLKQKYTGYITFINEMNLNELDNIALKKIINKIEAYTYINDIGNEVKDLYINWNILDKSFDDIYLNQAIDEVT